MATKRTATDAPDSTVAKVAKLTHEMCSTCKVMLPVEGFNRNASKASGLQSYCRSCASVRNILYRNTYQGFLCALLSHSKTRNAKRNNKGRQMEYSITMEHLLSLPQTCYYTAVPLVFQPHSHYSASLERLDPTVGYTMDNSVLICQELNTSAQMTSAKIQTLFSGIVHGRINISPDELIASPRVKQYKWVKDADGMVFCHYCKLTKSVDQFNRTRAQGCKSCTAARTKTTWHGVVGVLCRSAKSHSHNGRARKTFNITKQDIVDQLVKQHGLCAYSRYPMSKTGDFKASLERRNPLLGYERSNIVLIVNELNSGDKSSMKTERSNSGSAGMSRRKYLHMLRHILPEEQYEEYILNTGED
jgi:hypothetical protein